MSSRWPLIVIALLVVLILCFDADVLVGKRLGSHVLIGILAAHVGHSEELSIKRTLHQA
jgi:hypothetical protein